VPEERQPLRGKTALVTGAARRLGRETALALARQGANVAIHYRSSEDEAGLTAKEISAVGVDVWLVQGDLSTDAGAENVFETCLKAAGPVDILVNSASIFSEDGLLNANSESIDASVRVNAAAPLTLGRLFAAQGLFETYGREHGREGCIVNFLDARISDYDRHHVSYHLSKKMLFAITRMMALDFAPAVRVNAVAPGLILPPEGKDESYLESLASTNPLGRYGDGEDIAQATVFLVLAPFITGQVIFVDGGRHMLGGVYG
jgi:hypothetical protein